MIVVASAVSPPSPTSTLAALSVLKPLALDLTCPTRTVPVEVSVVKTGENPNPQRTPTFSVPFTSNVANAARHLYVPTFITAVSSTTKRGLPWPSRTKISPGMLSVEPGVTTNVVVGQMSLSTLPSGCVRVKVKEPLSVWLNAFTPDAISHVAPPAKTTTASEKSRNSDFPSGAEIGQFSVCSSALLFTTVPSTTIALPPTVNTPASAPNWMRCTTSPAMSFTSVPEPLRK